jgi:rhamnosyltransferase
MFAPATHRSPVVALVIPTFNAAASWPQLLESIRSQTSQPNTILVIDSSSRDGTADLASAAGFQVVRIAQKDFNHGRTRQLALQYVPEAEFLIYLTQDALFADADALHNLLASFTDPRVAVAYGRQLPRLGAGYFEAAARLFNYPSKSQERCFADRTRYGFKTVFCSNSFAAYRRSALEQVGGFPGHLIMGEDTVVAARILREDYLIAYVASACARHSHRYSLVEEFRRYFDTGVLHRRESWLQKTFGHTANEGMRYMRYEIRYIIQRAPWLLPILPLRMAAKWSGYRLGCLERYLPLALKRIMSMQRNFWDEANSPSA